MTSPVVSDSSIFINAPVEKTFAAALGLDAPAIIRPHRILPGVKAVAGDAAGWAKAGDRRRLTLTNGSNVEETLTEVGSTSYKYRVTGFSGPFGFLVKEANAAFEVAPRKTGSMLSWTYEFTPASPLAAPFVDMIASSLWTEWMDAALDRLKEAIEAK
jgi:hypothetical protein